MGTYGYDKMFLEKHGIDFLELKSSDAVSKILIIPGWQGRVMTSSAKGDEGRSFGWINYSLIESGKTNSQFNAFGGEERFWLGPEGGPFSIYFAEGREQVFDNWQVPSVLDTESYTIKEVDNQSVTFGKSTYLTNASGTEFYLDIERNITLLHRDEVASLLKVDIPSVVNMVAYQTNNIITNTGNDAWTKENGLISVWMLCMFTPSPSTIVFIPFQTEGEGVIVNDDYFGKVPPERLIVEEKTIFFKADGMYRSKIGVPPGRANNLCGSYDSLNKVLTVLWYNMPENEQTYVNSKWGSQDDPYDGDVINSYNDGPLEDGSIMGPFYELETSSPAAALSPQQSMQHIQRVMHFMGDEQELASIVKVLFNLELSDITRHI